MGNTFNLLVEPTVETLFVLGTLVMQQQQSTATAQQAPTVADREAKYSTVP